MTLSFDGRRFAPVGETGGEVGAGTVFEFGQDGDLVWARYAGGGIRLGFLVGTLAGDVLSFRYAQVGLTGETATGHSTDRVELLPDGRLRLHETWEWESRPGSGTSTLEEI